MKEIVERARLEVERRIEQAVVAERQERMTGTMALLAEWGFAYSRIVVAVREIFGEPFTVAAVKMRVRTRRLSLEKHERSLEQVANDKSAGALE